VGEAEGYGERGDICAGACTEVGDICEWRIFMRGENYGWRFFCKGGLFPKCLP